MLHVPSTLFAAATLACLVATSPLTAQTPVVVRCTPTDGSAAGCYYCPGFESVIKLVGTQLHSSSINLVAYHDLDVLIHGTWNGTVVEVSSIQLEAESFSIGGNGTLGHRFDFSTVATSGNVAINIAALGASFLVPIADLAVQLNPASMAVLDAGVISGGEYKSRLDIPNVPSLIGLRVFGQGVVLEQNGNIYTTNVDSKVIN